MDKKLLYLVLTTSILALTGSASADPVARWSFNNSPDDQVGGLTWTLNNGATFSTDRKEGSASLLCDGVDDYASLPGSGLMSAAFATKTVMLWFKPNTTTGMQTLYDEGGSGNGLSIRINDGKLDATVRVDPYIAPLCTPLSSTNWSHVAVSFDNGIFKLYFNGVEVGSTMAIFTSIPAHTNGSGLGARNSADAFGRAGTGDYFGGLIDDVQVHSEALWAETIQEIAAGRPHAWQPLPADGAVGVMAPMMSWKPGATALFHNVYFGTDPNPPLVSSRQPFTAFYYLQGLKPDTTYYWRIDEVEANGTTIHEGPVWKFTSEPLKNYAPTPADGTIDALPGLVLTWRPGKGALQYQVFFGADQAAVTSGAASVDQGKVSAAKFDTGTLGQGMSYFWRVDLIKADKSVVEGDVWSFSTADAGPANKIKFEVWLNLGGGLVVSDLTSNAQYPAHPDAVEYLDSWLHPAGGTGTVDWRDCYGSRMYSWLKPEQTGDYTFWIAGDDEQQLWLSTDDSPANIKMIANVANWTPAQDFDNTQGGVGGPTQKSAPIKLEAGKKYFIMTLMKEGYGGDSTAVAWQGPGIPTRQIIPAKYMDMFHLPRLQAWGSSPTNGVVDVAQSPTLNWMAGDKAQKHEVYFGEDQAAVATADTKSPLYRGQQAGTTYNASNLDWGKTYYWRVDEINPGEAQSPWKGMVWSFTTANFIAVDSFECYTDKEGQEIFSTWIDGYTDNSSGSLVGYQTAAGGTYGEAKIVHGGMQAMPLAYNNATAPFYSEAVQTFATAQDWTAGGVTDLSLWVRGYPAATSVPVTETGGKMTLIGAGTDIWNESDEFTFAYKTLTGDGSMTARVVSIGPGSNTWAKAGVMIRDSLNGGSTFAMTVMTANSDGSADNGASFQWRPTANSATGLGNTGSTSVVQPPYWVKMERLGEQITGYLSPDGRTWTTLGSIQTITMTAPVYIGICVTSHSWREPRTCQFDSIATTGNVSVAWQGAEITNAWHNSAGPLYVVVEDSAGKSATAAHATAVNATAWTEWEVPLSSLTGVNLAQVKKLYIGVGDRKAPVADGTGIVFVDDIRVVKP